MQQKELRPNLKIKNPLRWLLLAYTVGVAARFLLCLAASQNPFVMPDEALYANLARSIASGMGTTLRNQPITYTNLLYPLLLSPIYALAAPGSQFRLIQLFNCLLMNLAVFPTWHIARRFSTEKKVVVGITLLSILLPDMLLTSRIMTEAVEYPLFLLAALLMFQRFEGRDEAGHAGLAAVCVFLLAQAKSGMIALAVVFAGMLVFNCVRDRRLRNLRYLLVFVGVYAALTLLAHWGMGLLPGMDYIRPSIYDTQTQLPTLQHLKQTLPGLLLYCFFIPVAFGLFPLLLPACNLKRYASAQRKQVILALLALAVVAAGACYMFFDTETVGNFYAGRIHIRYVFMFLPLFLAFLSAPALEGTRPTGKLIASMGFLLAMAATVGFGALLSNRRYPVDAISLSWITFDDPAINIKLLAQIAAITFGTSMLWLLLRHGWGRKARALMAVCMILSVLSANVLGYDMNNWNNSKALSADAKQAAELLDGKPTLLAPSSGIYFDNTLSVLDCSMRQAPYAMLLEDVCANLGPYGELDSVKPPKYWTESPDKEIPAVGEVVMNGSAFNNVVLAHGAQVQATANNTYGIVTLGADRRLFHSALAGLDDGGQPKANCALYIFDEELLSKPTLTVYLQVVSTDASKLALTCGGQSVSLDAGPAASWVSCTFAVPKGATRLVVAIQKVSGAPRVLTYKVG